MEVWDGSGVIVEDMEKQLAELHVQDGQKVAVTDTRMTIGDDIPKPSESTGSEDTVSQSNDISSYPSSSSYSTSSSSSSYTSSYAPYSSYYDSRPSQPPPPAGLVGLNNLGM